MKALELINLFESGKLILANSFSINMLSSDVDVSFRKLELSEAKKMLEKGFESAIGHNDLAAILTDMLSIEVNAVRTTVSLGKSFELIVAQYRGARLPEGTKTLPTGATIEFWLVKTK